MPRSALLVLLAFPHSFRSGGCYAADASCPFDKLEDGLIGYGMNDGGCYFCSQVPGSSLPLTGAPLIDACQQMCMSDPDCVAFEVGREGVLPAYEHGLGGTPANCCFEKRSYPSSVWVDGRTAQDTCGDDSICWTRYEKPSQGGGSCEVTAPSDQCRVIFEPTSFTTEELQGQADFIAEGCPYDDGTFVELLGRAREQCEAELASEGNTSAALPSKRGRENTIFGWIIVFGVWFGVW